MSDDTLIEEAEARDGLSIRELRAENARLKEALDAIRQYGNHILTGPADGPDDRKWHRGAVFDMTRHAFTALEPPHD